MTDPIILMIVRGHGRTLEAEPILIQRTGSEITFLLDDDDRLIFDRDELIAALNIKQPSKEAGRGMAA